MPDSEAAAAFQRGAGAPTSNSPESLRLVPPLAPQSYRTAADVPGSLRVEAGQTCVAADFGVADALVRAGVDSSQIAVVPPGQEALFEAAVAARRPGAAFVPPRPYPCPGRGLVVIPTYDERENIEAIVRAARQQLDADVLIADDASPDGTGEIADGIAAADPGVHVLHRTGRRGLGRAYVDGFRFGMERGYDVLFSFDADFSHPPNDLPRLAHRAASADLVLGSRYVRGGDTRGWSWRRRAVSRAGNTYAQMWLGLGVRDATAGFRAYRASVLEKVDLGAVRAEGYAFQIEMAYRVRRAGGAIAEVPIHFVDRQVGYSKMSFRIAFEAMVNVPRLRLGG
ncbi:MAG: polyprenol monophosphomannose synthase [Planctomycetota bacterium]|nr:polyprenol monophosphomannose synthase [Planctomycetota bacterium]